MVLFGQISVDATDLVQSQIWIGNVESYAVIIAFAYRKVEGIEQVVCIKDVTDNQLDFPVVGPCVVIDALSVAARPRVRHRPMASQASATA